MAGQYDGEVTIKKCEHGVYDPHGDQSYCSVCNPKIISAVAKVHGSTGGIKIGVFKNPDEIKDQAFALINFYKTLPADRQPSWYPEFFKNRNIIRKNVTTAVAEGGN